ncbi:hypothetical protein [Microbacterium sp. SLBN-146]|uniref:hypothetical protein n=1 Tax=Microbacterium sp. SLBN-146 TaxID=2768457 RepID=UPI0011500765|nr:hypothetical protein [Microbacterium sp. SLBN-146]TQJ30610.1 hypothetical protein FBY39_1063 [Microbacterium sp. SLBN-146]
MTEPEVTPTDAARRSGLTRGMLIAILAVGAAIIVGVAIVISLLVSSGSSPEASSDPTSTATSGPNPGASPADGSEVQSPAPDATSDRIPPIPTASPLVTAPLPASASAEGELVAGFPADVMAPAPGSEVLSSSIATEGTTMQVDLVARTDAAQDDVEAHFRDLWGRLGLIDSPAGDDAIVSSANAFTAVSLAFTPASGTGTVYMVHGVLRTE